MRPRVFISYSRTDFEVVQFLIVRLKQTGFDIWLDHERLPVGTQDWEREIRKGISSANGVIYVASIDAANSNYVRDELNIAQSNHIPIYPIWVRGEHWIECVPLGFGRIQYIDGRHTRLDRATQQLVSEIQGAVLPSDQHHRINPDRLNLLRDRPTLRSPEHQQEED